ncbi:ATP-binding protein [Azospirillum picis]|uniref:Anti-sigma regulatory factor (Ser/Thr protein kinase) n=1 Tax=Azospirillum picis TaxID=488438 RepID=A0ABU0MFJ8_9PROT|nr:ATP-binding protein [Azospirillum picis]MBP2298738.1 anti-sigma regulatory factor (Ser/Thr protein kinase) [Azospirillum picis]MDQ0532213.1 anti-sigma regulatory factor (Ser/Thr protein kinase) [Azospirillum picis]
MTNRLDMVLRNDLAELERLAAAVDEFIERNDLPPALGFSFNLCFDELITNTVSYGYHDGTPHEIRVRLEAAGNELRAELVDDGAAFDPFADAPPPDLTSDIDERRVGGLGVFLVKQTMDRTAYRREGDRNIVLLAKTLG